MTSSYLGEIQLFGFDFAPRGWASCNGALLTVMQNSTLFALLGNTYGGNGTTFFHLPNLVGRAAFEQGQSFEGSSYTIGESVGYNQISLAVDQIPPHSHALTVFAQNTSTSRANSPSAGNALSVPLDISTFRLKADDAPTVAFAPVAVGPGGGGLPHENRQPFLAVNFCISLEGVFPSFS